MRVNQRASFQFVVSPLTIAELANVQHPGEREYRVRWALDVLGHWITMLDDIGDRHALGGKVRTRFKLSEELQQLEARLMAIPALRRDPFDRLLLIQYKMGECDGFLTTDEGTVWRHREQLASEDIRVLLPRDLWDLIKPWAGIWC